MRKKVRALIVLALCSAVFGRCECQQEKISPPALVLPETAVDFGKVTIGATKEREFVVSNGGGSGLTISAVIETPGSRFAVKSAPSGVSPFENGTIVLAYSPTEVKLDSDNLIITSNDSAHPSVTVILTGQGVEEEIPEISVKCTPEGAPNPVTCRILNFGDVSSAEAGQSIMIANTGAGILRIESVDAVDHGGGDAFSFKEAADLPAEIAAGESKNFTVVFKPSAGGLSQGCLLIHSNDPDTGESLECVQGGFQDYHNPWQINLLGNSAAPNIEVCVPVPEGEGMRCSTPPPLDLDFGETLAGQPKSLDVKVRNTGSAALTVTRIETVIGTSEEFAVAPGREPPFDLQPNAEETITVTYTPADLSTDTGFMAVSSNDPDEPQVVVSFNGSSMPDIDVNPLAYDFLNIQLNAEASVEVVITNTGYSTLTVTEIKFGEGHHPNFSLRNQPNTPFDVGAGEQMSFEIVFTNRPPGGQAADTVLISSNDPDAWENPTQILLYAKSQSNLPPVANGGPDVTRFNYNLAAPETLTLDGSASTDDGNQITKYEWTLVFKPRGSNASLSATDTVTTTITPDAFGLYVVGLTVYDDAMQPSLRDDVNISINP